jgi:hypothetical protein
MRSLTWLGARKLELAIFGIGVLLRLSMYWNYHPRWSYDTDSHWAVVEWIVAHHAVPPSEATFSSFHPPLYYATAAWLVEHGLTRKAVTWFSIGCGIVRLAIIWAGLELYVVRSRWARVLGLGLAATISASVHIDGMVYPEALSCMLNAAAILVVPLAFRRRAEFRWPLTTLVGFLLGLAILTKTSAMAVIGALLLAVLFELAFARKPFAERMKDALPWAGMVGVCVGMSGWYYVRNVREYGTPFVTSFALPSQRWLAAPSDKVPLLDRRTLGFVFGWSDAIYKNPYRPSGYSAHPRFFPLAIASSVVDYWGYGFQGFEEPMKLEPERAGKPAWKVRDASQCAAFGGTAIFLAAVGAWLFATWQLVKLRDTGRLTLLLVPLTTLLAALYFAICYPIDDYGVVKGVYMTFGAAPVYGLFGVAGGWAQRKPARWPLLGVCLFALWLVASYTVLCRFGVRIWPRS